MQPNELWPHIPPASMLHIGIRVMKMPHCVQMSWKIANKTEKSRICSCTICSGFLLRNAQRKLIILTTCFVYKQVMQRPLWGPEGAGCSGKSFWKLWYMQKCAEERKREYWIEILEDILTDLFGSRINVSHKKYRWMHLFKGVTVKSTGNVLTFYPP